MSSTTGYRAPSVGRALKILELVAESREGLGISDLARRLDISKGTVFGLCTQLEAGGALVRDTQTKLYGLGPLIATLARRGFVQARLRDAAGPELTRLCDQIKESVFLGVLGRGEVMVVESRQPAGQIRISAGPGTRLPLTAGAVGKVFMAGMTPAQLDEVIDDGLPAHTPHSITDPEVFRRQLEEVRRQGYAVERDEYLLGIWGAAAPLGGTGGLPAALYSIGFTSAAQPGSLPKVAQALCESARRIGKALGEARR